MMIFSEMYNHKELLPLLILRDGYFEVALWLIKVHC